MNRALRTLALGSALASLSLAVQPAIAGSGAASAKDAHAAHVASPSATSAAASHAGMVHADVIGVDGKSLGMVMLQQTPAGVLLTANVSGIPAGEHGFHFHEKGTCSTADKFNSAGGHFSTGHQHGLLTEGGPHGGDMPNQYVGADGLLKTQVLNTGVSLTGGATSIYDADGTALVIHAKADDYTSQPSGNAGDRLACAVVAKPK